MPMTAKPPAMIAVRGDAAELRRQPYGKRREREAEGAEPEQQHHQHQHSALGRRAETMPDTSPFRAAKPTAEMSQRNSMRRYL